MHVPTSPNLQPPPFLNSPIISFFPLSNPPIKHPHFPSLSTQYVRQRQMHRVRHSSTIKHPHFPNFFLFNSHTAGIPYVPVMSYAFTPPVALPHSKKPPARQTYCPCRHAARRPRHYAHANLDAYRSPRDDSSRPLGRKERTGYADLNSLPLVAPKLQVATNVEGGRGLAVRPGCTVEPFEVIARIPIESALVVCFEDDLSDSAIDDYPFPADSWVSFAYWRAADWDLKLSALLLYHALCDTQSPWGAYLRSLPVPEQLVTAADLDDIELEDVQYGALVDAVEVYQYRVETEYARLLRALPQGLKHVVTRRLFEWAMKIVHSRAFSIPPGGFAASSTRAGLRGKGRPGPEWPRKFALVPLLDMTNHGSGRNLARFRYDDRHKCFELVGGEEGYKGGGQILVSYGELTNDDLFLLYGFVQAGNPNDVFEVEDVVEWAGSAGNLLRVKVELLDRVGLCYEGRKFWMRRTGIDRDLMAVLRVLLASAEEFERLRSFVKIESKGDRFAVGGIKKVVPEEWYRPLSEGNERRVWERIERQCERMLKEFVTSVELDEEMIILHAASAVPVERSMATVLLFRVEKKRILRSVVEMARERRMLLEVERDGFDNMEVVGREMDLWSDVE